MKKKSDKPRTGTAKGFSITYGPDGKLVRKNFTFKVRYGGPSSLTLGDRKKAAEMLRAQGLVFGKDRKKRAA